MCTATAMPPAGMSSGCTCRVTISATSASEAAPAMAAGAATAVKLAIEAAANAADMQRMGFLLSGFAATTVPDGIPARSGQDCSPRRAGAELIRVHRINARSSCERHGALRALDQELFSIVLERNTRNLPRAHGGHEMRELERGVGIDETFRADVGDAVA